MLSAPQEALAGHLSIIPASSLRYCGKPVVALPFAVSAFWPGGLL